LAARSGFTYEQNELFERNERRKGRSAKRMEKKQRVMGLGMFKINYF